MKILIGIAIRAGQNIFGDFENIFASPICAVAWCTELKKLPHNKIRNTVSRPSYKKSPTYPPAFTQDPFAPFGRRTEHLRMAGCGVTPLCRSTCIKSQVRKYASQRNIFNGQTWLVSPPALIGGLGFERELAPLSSKGISVVALYSRLSKAWGDAVSWG